MTESNSRSFGLTLLAPGFLSLAGYLGACFGLKGLSTRVDVTSFLGVFAALFAIYFWVVWRVRESNQSRRPRFGLQVLMWGLLFRLAMLPTGISTGSIVENIAGDLKSSEVTYQTFLLYDNDIWRYLWDGHVSSSGFNPYELSPRQIAEHAESGREPWSSLLKDRLWQDVFDNISYQEFGTIYPPAAQLFFRITHAFAPASVFFFKFCLICIDLGSCFLLTQILQRITGRPGDAVIYAWNPLVIKEFAGSGHIDALMIFTLLFAVLLTIRGAEAAGIVTLACSILVKISPLLIVGLILRRVRLRFWPLLPATLVIGYLPFAGSINESVSNLAAFSRQWVFNPGPWLAFEWVFHNLLGIAGRVGADGLSLCMTLVLVAVVTLGDSGTSEQLIFRTSLILGGTLLLSAAVMPWYLIWVLPFASCHRGWSWIALTGLSLFSYLIYIDGIEHSYWLWIEYATFLIVLGWDLSRNRLRVRQNSTPKSST